MNKEEKIAEICKESIGMLSNPLSQAISNALSKGYELGWTECLKTLGIKVEEEGL